MTLKNTVLVERSPEKIKFNNQEMPKLSSHESKKVKAPDPHLRGLDVGHGEAADGIYPHSGEVSARVQQESGGPEP